MAANKGKAFEAQVEAAWERTFGENSILRLPDQMSGYLTASQNPCDYIAFKKPRMYLIECKETTENTLNWKAFPQYERLLKYVGIDGMIAGVIIWFRTKDITCFVSIKDCIKMHEEGKKSINVKDVEDPNYNILKISGVKKRVYTDYDLSAIADLPDTW